MACAVASMADRIAVRCTVASGARVIHREGCDRRFHERHVQRRLESFLIKAGEPRRRARLPVDNAWRKETALNRRHML